MLPDNPFRCAKDDSMSVRLNPYLAFDGNARAAMKFYATVFGAELNLTTFGQYGAKEPAIRNKIMHAQLETDDGLTIMAADLPPGMERSSGSNITVSLSGDDAERLRGYWKKLSRGGQVTMPLERQMWGDEFGQCTDKFGVAWMINIGGQAQA
jgi:PhnB protein